jgi:hypothetical protein
MDTYKYELQLQVKDFINSDCLYYIELTQNEEDDPEQLRQKIEQNKSNIREDIQNQLDQKLVPPRRLTRPVLNEILETWMENILEGQFLTILTRELQIISAEDLENIVEDGPAYELPDFLPPDPQEIDVRLALLLPLNF